MNPNKHLNKYKLFKTDKTKIYAKVQYTTPQKAISVFCRSNFKSNHSYSSLLGDKMLDIPSISAIVAAVGVLVGVALTVLELRNLVQTRQTELVMRLYSSRASKEFQEAWKKVMAKEFKDYHDYEKWYEWSDYIEVGIFFEGIGILLCRKLIDIRLVDDLFSYIIKATWEKIKRVVEEVRKRNNAPQIFEWFEYLYNEMQKREQQLAKTP